MAKKPEYEVEDWQTAYYNAKTTEEQEKALKDYEDAKLRNAERREQYRLELALERHQQRKAKFKRATALIKSMWGRWVCFTKNFFKKQNKQRG